MDDGFPISIRLSTFPYGSGWGLGVQAGRHPHTKEEVAPGYQPCPCAIGLVQREDTHRRAGALIPAQHVESRHDSVSLRLATWDAIATLRVAYRLVAFRSSTSAWLHASAYVWPLIEGPMYRNLDSSRPSRLFQVRLATIRARPICRGKIM